MMIRRECVLHSVQIQECRVNRGIGHIRPATIHTRVARTDILIGEFVTFTGIQTSTNWRNVRQARFWMSLHGKEMRTDENCTFYERRIRSAWNHRRFQGKGICMV